MTRREWLNKQGIDYEHDGNGKITKAFYTVEWKDYDGSGMPVYWEAEVMCKLRCGLVTPKLNAAKFDWKHHYRNFYNNPSDIIAYAVC